MQPETAVTATRLAITLKAVIDFPKKVVVLLNIEIVRFEVERRFVGVSCLVESSLVFVGDTEVVPGWRVAGIEFRCSLPAIDRLSPQASLGDRDPEINLGLRVGSFIRLSRNGSGYRQYICEDERPDHHTSHIHYSYGVRGSQVRRVVMV